MMPCMRRAVLDTLWHDIELTRLQRNVTIFGFDCHASFQHQKEIIGIIMEVPNEFTLGFHNHDVIVILAGYDFRAPLIFEAGQFFCQIDFFRHVCPPLDGASMARRICIVFKR